VTSLSARPPSDATPAAALRDRVLSARHAVAKVIVGQEAAVEGVLVALLGGGHVLMEGPPGVGKTLLVKTITRLLGLSSARIQFTPDLLPSDILGGATLERDATGRESLVFKRGPLFANTVLADELNRASPRTQAAFLEAMEERQVTAFGQTHRLAEPFMVLATQNPLDEGTYPLPGSQLDRFLVHLRVEPPAESDLVAILERDAQAALDGLQPILDVASVRAMGQVAGEVVVAAELRAFIAAIVTATDPRHPSAPAGVRDNLLSPVSPRGALALLRAGRVVAAMAGRHHLAKQDVSHVAVPVLRHRLAVDAVAEARGVSRDELVQEAVAAAYARR